MPSRAPTACRRPGCAGVVRGGMCSRCGPVRRDDAQYDERRGTAAQRGYDGLWQRARRVKLAEQPLCEECLRQGRVRAAALVDHIVPMADGGARLDPENWQSLCEECHATKTVRDLAQRRRGRGVQILAPDRP